MQSAIEFITSARFPPVLLLILSFVVAVPGARAQITVEAGDLDTLAGQTFDATLYTNESPSNTAALQALAGVLAGHDGRQEAAQVGGGRVVALAPRDPPHKLRIEGGQEALLLADATAHQRVFVMGTSCAHVDKLKIRN